MVASEAANGLGGHFELEFELIDLHYLCSCVSLASKGLHELNDTEEGGQT